MRRKSPWKRTKNQLWRWTGTTPFGLAKGFLLRTWQAWKSCARQPRSPSSALWALGKGPRRWKRTCRSMSLTTSSRSSPWRSARGRWARMANAIMPVTGGLRQSLMIVQQSSESARSGDWRSIQSTLCRRAMLGLVVGMKPLLMQWRHTPRTTSRAWPMCLEKHNLQRGLEKPPARLGNASPLRPKGLGKATSQAWKSLPTQAKWAW